MIEANKYKLGIFILTAIILMLVCLFLLGLSKLFEPRIEFITIFNESVQGLDVGAAVKYRGVTIGQVKRIALMPQKGKDNLVIVTMEAQLAAIAPKREKYKDSNIAKEQFFYRFFTQEVKKGLRCRLNLAGITGIKYVEIDYFDTKGNSSNEIRFNAPEGAFYLPSTPSLLSKLSHNLTWSFQQLASIDFKKISEEMEKALIGFNTNIGNLKLNKLVDKLNDISVQLETTVQTINNTITEKRISKIMDELETSLDSIRNLSEELKRQATDAQVPATAYEVRNTLQAFKQLKTEVSETLTSLNTLLNYLNDDPSALVRGKQQAPVDFGNNGE